MIGRHPKSSSVDTFTPEPPKSSMKQLGNQSSALPEVEDKTFDPLGTLIGHENKEILEDIDKICKKQCLPKLSM